MSMLAVHSKRKEPEESVVELFRNVSLSPPKRVRVPDSWVPTNPWPTPSFEPQVEVQVTAPQAHSLSTDAVPAAPPPLMLPAVDTANRATGGIEEKAIILYKPVNPPLFPGGPPTGSAETPFIVDTTGVLAACKGTGNNGSSVDAGHASSALNCSPDAHIWTGLFEALDLQGRKPLLPTRRLQRTSSCSSLPHFSSSIDDTSMEEETDTQASGSNSQLALVPYSPSPFLGSAVNSAEPPSNTVLNYPGADLNEEMVDGVDAMDVTEGSVPTGGGGSPESGSQFGSPIPTFGSAQWEPCDIFKAPYSKVMWSH